MRHYIALIHKDAGSDYGVSFPDLPGSVTAGVDLDDAMRRAEEALALHLTGMAEDGEVIPEPSSLETVMADRENRDAVAVLVKAPPPAEAVGANLALSQYELEQIDKFAAEHGYGLGSLAYPEDYLNLVAARVVSARRGRTSLAFAQRRRHVVRAVDARHDLRIKSGTGMPSGPSDAVLGVRQTDFGSRARIQQAPH
jgi:predicted RNase H-like HicB family nuclease